MILRLLIVNFNKLLLLYRLLLILFINNEASWGHNIIVNINLIVFIIVSVNNCLAELLCLLILRISDVLIIR